VTLAYLKGKDAESEEAQEHANSSSLALYAWTQNVTAGVPGMTEISRSCFHAVGFQVARYPCRIQKWLFK
jgi:hypothetical protein